MEVSTMIGAEIFSPAGEKLGYVKNVYLSKDRKKITCLSCVDEGESGEDDEFVMPFRAIISVKDVVIARKMRIEGVIGAPAPVGINAYSMEGEALGTLCEILVGDGGPVYIVSKGGVRTPYPDGSVIIGEAAMISPSGEKKVSTKSRAKRTVNREGKAEKKAAPQPQAEPPVQPTTEPLPPEFIPILNAPTGLDRLNLLGRQVKIAVRDKNGEVIAPSGQRITPEILSLARKNNLLLRLTVNTLTNLL